MTIHRKSSPIKSKHQILKVSAKRHGDKNKTWESELENSVWFHETQLMPMLSPFWAWRHNS